MNNAQLPVEDFLIAVADGVQIECRQFPEPSRVKKQIETALILAHPYPPMGGDMDNNVVMALFEGLVDQFGDRVLVLAYNSRGAGRTTARCSWTGASEVQDVKALMDHLCKRHTSIKKFILCVLDINVLESIPIYVIGIFVWGNDLVRSTVRSGICIESCWISFCFISAVGNLVPDLF